MVALLLGALGVSWKGFRSEVKNASPAELGEQRRQIDEIRADRERLKAERERIVSEVPSSSSVPEEPAVEESVVPGSGNVERVEALPEERLSLPVVDEAARVRAIAAAPVLGKIAEWVEDPALGSFATVEVMDAAAVKVGSVLCVRRNSGILGRLEVGEVLPEGAIATPLSGFGDLKPSAGDELIAAPTVD